MFNQTPWPHFTPPQPILRHLRLVVRFYELHTSELNAHKLRWLSTTVEKLVYSVWALIHSRHISVGRFKLLVLTFAHRHIYTRTYTSTCSCSKYAQRVHGKPPGLLALAAARALVHSPREFTRNARNRSFARAPAAVSHSRRCGYFTATPVWDLAWLHHIGDPWAAEKSRMVQWYQRQRVVIESRWTKL